MKQRGFTVIELVVVVAFLCAIAAVAWTQIKTLNSMHRDDTRRTAINAMYYSLEDVYYQKNKSYPRTIDEKTITAIDPSLLADPDGAKIGTAESNYKYLPTDCVNDVCKSYSIRSTMEREADYVKTSRNN